MPLTRKPDRIRRIAAARVEHALDLSSHVNEDEIPRHVSQDSLSNRIGQAIVAGTFPPGSLLPAELEMRKRYSVSRTALREAYQVLAGKSLIVARPKVGTRVRPKSEWNMLDPEVLAWHLQTLPAEDFVADLYVLRQIVEPAAAAITASTRSAEALAKIESALADMDSFRDGSGDLIAADARFHLAILSATDNYFIGALGSLIRAALFATFELSWEGAARMQDERLGKHRVILDAIRDKNPELARKRMIELLDDSLRDVHDSLDRRKAR
jgi:GntR family transcriptional regulator, galactonate operon transcriptional repressor